MSIMDAIEKNGNELSPLNGEFQSYLRQRSLSGPIPLRDRANSELMRTYEYSINSWPFFVAPEFVAQMRDMSSSIPPLIYKALRATFANDPLKMAQVLRLDPVHCTVFLSGVRFANLGFRSDAVVTEQGLRLLEINAGTAIGGWQAQWFAESFLQFDAYREFFARYPVKHRNIAVAFFQFLFQSARQVAATAEVYVLVKTIPERTLDEYGSELQQYIAAANAASGEHATVGYFETFDELQVTHEGVFHNGKRVHVVTFGELRKETPPIEMLRCVLAGKLACPDFPSYLMFSDKRNLAVLHHAASNGLLSASESRLVEKYVPKSYLLGGPLSVAAVRADLPANKDRYVVKVCDGYQGTGVYVGRFMTQRDWETALAAIEKPELYIVQEYCESKQFYRQSGTSREAYRFIWGIFQFGEFYGGCWVRMMAEGRKYDGVINSARGAEESVVFEAAG